MFPFPASPGRPRQCSMVELSSVSAAVECRDTGGGGEGAGGVAGGVVFVLELYQDRDNTILSS